MRGEQKAKMDGLFSTVRIGPAGWSYADWEGVVYPSPRPRSFHEAAYLANFFDTIEINTSFYHPPRPESAGLWLARVEHNPRFMFTAKLWQRFTHERSANMQDKKVFEQGLAPLVEAGRLGALLLQFPWSFKNNKENREYLGGLVVEFMEYPLVVEIRHGSWNHPEVFAWLSEMRVGFCNIDQPLIGRSLAPSERTTAPVGYVRLHGRNYEHWFTSEGHAEERYNYLYSMQELEPWAERIRHIAAQADATYVITNNHFQGKAIANALQLIRLVSSRLVRVPEALLAHYPELKEVARPESEPPAPKQAELLFDSTATKD